MASQKTVEEVREIFLQAADIVRNIAPPVVIRDSIDIGFNIGQVGKSIEFAAKSHLIGKVMDEIIRRDVFEQANVPETKGPRTL